MTPKLELYRVFCQVAQSLSFSKAAHQLYLSQPAVSQAVRQLEEQLGTQLFAREARGVSLTSQGKLLYEYASSALGLIATVEEKLVGLSDLSQGELRVGAGDAITKHLLLPALEEFHGKYPQVRLSILNRTSLESIELLQSGVIDIAFVNLPLSGEKITVHQTFQVQDIFVAGAKFTHLQRAPLSLEELAAQPLIMLERKSNTRGYIEKFFLNQGVSISPEIAVASYSLLLELAKINLGVSCVIRSFAQEYLESGQLFEIPLQTPFPLRSIGMVSLKNVSLIPAAQQLLEILNQQHAAQK